MNTMYDLRDLNLTKEQEARVLEWYARKLWVLFEESTGDADYSGKSYDPLTIDLDKRKAYSYVFNLDGKNNRDVSFVDLYDLEKKIDNYSIQTGKYLVERTRNELLQELKINDPQYLI